MATVNLGRIKFVWQGAYNGATAYVADDVVSYNGSSYICILASTGNLPTNATYWSLMAQSGTDITSLAGLAQGDVLYYNGTSWVRLGAGTSGQFLKTNGASANPAWANVTSSILQVKRTIFTGTASISIATAGTYYQIPTNDFSVSITPQFSNSVILLLGMIRHSQDTSGAHRVRVGLFRDSTQIALNTDSLGSRTSAISSSWVINETEEVSVGNIIYIDSPATTSAINYNFKMTSNASSVTGYINRGADDTNTTNTPRTVSSIIAIEIANGVL
jgi:hypothetical protein